MKKPTKKKQLSSARTTKTKIKPFEAGQAIVFIPKWSEGGQKKGATVYKGHPLKYGDIVHFLAHMTPAYGHCIVTTYEGTVITMLHPSDFRLATDEEV